MNAADKAASRRFSATYDRNYNYTDVEAPAGSRPYSSFTAAQQAIIDAYAELLVDPSFNPLVGITTGDVAQRVGCDQRTVQAFVKGRLEEAKYAIFSRALAGDVKSRREQFHDLCQTGAQQIDAVDHSMVTWIDNMASHMCSHHDVGRRAIVSALARTEFGGEPAKAALRADYGDEWAASYTAFGTMAATFRQTAKIRTQGQVTPECSVIMISMLRLAVDVLKVIGWPEDEPPTLVSVAPKALLSWAFCVFDTEPDLDQRLDQLSGL